MGSEMCIRDRNHITNHNLDDADAVRHVERVVVLRQPHVRLLLAVGSNEGVHLAAGDLVHGLDRVLDLPLVRRDVDNEHERVVVLDLLHGGLGGQGVLDEGVPILKNDAKNMKKLNEIYAKTAENLASNIKMIRILKS